MGSIQNYGFRGVQRLPGLEVCRAPLEWGRSVEAPRYEGIASKSILRRHLLDAEMDTDRQHGIQ